MSVLCSMRIFNDGTTIVADFEYPVEGGCLYIL